jgi:hypothetical protein
MMENGTHMRHFHLCKRTNNLLPDNGSLCTCSRSVVHVSHTFLDELKGHSDKAQKLLVVRGRSAVRGRRTLASAVVQS